MSLREEVLRMTSVPLDEPKLKVSNPWPYGQIKNFKANHFGSVHLHGELRASDRVAIQEKEDGTNITTFVDKTFDGKYVIIICSRNLVLYVIHVNAERLDPSATHTKEFIFGLRKPDVRQYLLSNLDITLAALNLFDIRGKLLDLVEVALRVYHGVVRKPVVYWAEYRTRMVNRTYPQDFKFFKIFDLASFDEDFNVYFESTHSYKDALFKEGLIQSVANIDPDKIPKDGLQAFVDSLQYSDSKVKAEGIVIKDDGHLVPYGARNVQKVKAKVKDERRALLDKMVGDACKNYGYPKLRTDEVCDQIYERVLFDIEDVDGEYAELFLDFKCPGKKEVASIACYLANQCLLLSRVNIEDDK